MAEFIPSRQVQALPDNYFTSIDHRIHSVVSKGIDIIHLHTGSPDQPTPKPIIQAMNQAAQLHKNQGYPPAGGKTGLKEAIRAFYLREYGVSVDPDTEITVFDGATVAISALPQTMLNPGEIMLTADPGYPLYFACPQLAGAETYGIPVRAENGFLPDYRTIPENILQKSKLLMLNYPNNPTGAMATKEFFADTVAFSKKHHIPVVHDFAYAAFGFDGRRPLSFLQTPGAKEQGIEIYTLSKTYNMAGFRIGFAVGNASIIRALSQFHDIDHSDVPSAIQDAATAALLGSQQSVQELCALYEHRRDILVSGMRAIGWDVVAPQGSFFCWFRVPRGYSSEAFANVLLERAHVAMAPGAGFGTHGDQFVRAGLLESEERLKEAAERIKASGILKETPVQN
ncbi:aminotransferase class I/II-fold pyridoxal phosphate-dependent enzyme [Sporolactobacillus shoreicorticis]|uniref:Aminotransferase class I/II-fold pyridoxal phosphate-dependent enzyme n=1 Tax=Sporolactobacillus shoreicorticis TaxID=1923877 RepID=A0ABW5S7D2_9BACL|nr:aminotransferase class I/II-fold pyridoxal phosphate-dependent enzyme [Sporolactobacillus shoreicorticis]MCO7125545.1 aminotransferase class I/II-fold pyridoxal phosphate-dependent enzyme [Sporolactobacillus shoreicorticis]